MKILITNTFKRTAKKLHKNQIAILKKAITEISANPTIGKSKIGDLARIRVHKFHIYHQLILLAYIYNKQQEEITLLSFSSHENFYKDLKIQLEENDILKRF